MFGVNPVLRLTVARRAIPTAATTVVKGSLRNNISTTNLVATWHVVVTSPMSGAQSTLQVHNPRSQTHTLTSTLVHLVAHYSHCLPQHLRLTPGKHTPTLCGASRVRQLRRFGLNVYPLLCSQFRSNLAAIAWYELCIVNNNTWHTSNKCQLIPGGIIILRSKGWLISRTCCYCVVWGHILTIIITVLVWLLLLEGHICGPLWLQRFLVYYKWSVYFVYSNIGFMSTIIKPNNLLKEIAWY